MKSSRRGIVLISILVLTLVATFFIGALIQMNPSRLRRTVHDENRDKAAQAAQAGVDYALNRFKSDTDWNADENLQVVQMDDLVIREDNGNVLGWIKTEDGSWAGFRFRFNYQDGDLTASGDDDGRNDPTYPLSTSHVSVNNLNGPSGVNAPVADGSGYSVTGPTPDGPQTFRVPENTVALVVEGIVTPDLDPNDPRTLAEAEGGTVRTLKGIYVISEVREGIDGDAVLMAGGNATIQVGDLPRTTEIAVPDDLRGVLGLQSNSDNFPAIRTKGRMELTRGQAGSTAPMFDPDKDAEVRTSRDERFSTPFYNEEGDLDTFVGGEEGASDAFLEITWDKVEESEDTDAIVLPAGVYFFSDGDQAPGTRSEGASTGYYAMNWEDYRQAKIDGTLPPPSPVPTALAEKLELDSRSVTDADGNEDFRDVITIDQDVRVEITGDVTDLVIVPERGARQKAGTDGTAEGVPIAPGDFGSLPGPEQLEGTTQVLQHFSDGAFPGEPSLSMLVTSGGVTRPVTFDPGLPNNGITGPTQAVTVPAALGDGYFTLTNQEADTAASSFQGVEFTDVPPPFPGAPVMTREMRVTNPALFLSGFPSASPLYAAAGAATPDELHIPADSPDADGTVPQDIEIEFAPPEGGSAFIRSDGDIFLGTHISGTGGGIFSKKKIDMIGFGVDLEAKADSSEKDGVAIYGEQGINISTYDERVNKYWDVDIKGTIFTKGNLDINLGEAPLPDTSSIDDPEWGSFNYRGAIITLGQAHAIEAEVDPTNPGTEYTGTGEEDDGFANIDYINSAVGHTNMIARGVRLFYDPSFLAPYLEAEKINPTFAPVSVSIR